MIVLDEDDVYRVFVKALTGIALEEEATLVLKEICIYNNGPSISIFETRMFVGMEQVPLFFPTS